MVELISPIRLASQQGRCLISETDPTNPDSEKDLPLDGFEYSNWISPKRADDGNADANADGLTNLQEQIRETDPLNAATDSNGVNDGDEVAEPRHFGDKGQEPPDQSFAMGKLSVRDHSVSHSRRYFITVGPFKHQSLDYGKVGNCVYKHPPGK